MTTETSERHPFVRVDRIPRDLFVDIFLVTTCVVVFATSARQGPKARRGIRHCLPHCIPLPCVPSYSICVGDADGEKHPGASWKLTGGGGGDGGKYGTERARCS